MHENFIGKIFTLSLLNDLRFLSVHSHTKWKDSLETVAVLLLFSLELEVSGEALQGIHQNIQKWLLSLF